MDEGARVGNISTGEHEDDRLDRNFLLLLLHPDPHPFPLSVPVHFPVPMFPWRAWPFLSLGRDGLRRHDRGFFGLMQQSQRSVLFLDLFPARATEA